MAETTQTAAAAAPMGLLARALGVIVSPKATYTAVAARPRAFGILALAIGIMALAQFVFLSTEAGRNATLDQQIAAMKAFGVTVTDVMVQQMESQMGRARITGPITVVVFVPIVCAIMAGLLLAIFTAILGGGASFKHVYAIVSHSLVIGAVQQIFSFPIMYAQESMASPTRLSVFFPALDEAGFFYHLFSVVDLFYLWSTFNLAIGIAVLYKRSTGSAAAVLLGLYAVIALGYAAIRAF